MARAALRWSFRLMVLVLMGVTIGSISAGFLWSLDAVTRLRFGSPSLVWWLPLGGIAIVWVYRRFGGQAAHGTLLLLDEIQQPASGVPRRMAPFIFFGTLASHLFGASVGREGTALQIGGGIAAAFARHVPRDPALVRLLLVSGMAAGFGGVFGTPLAGACFALEILRRRGIRWTSLLPCLVAAFIAHVTCLSWGADHLYDQIAIQSDARLGDLARVFMVALAAGCCGLGFIKSTRALTASATRRLPNPFLRVAAGGLLLIALCSLSGTRDFLGLGVIGEFETSTTLPGFFSHTGASHFAWAWKWLFTTVALAVGFKGGEVTPLLFIGAALGNALAAALGGPSDLLAAVGMIAIFSATTKAPLASALLGIEFFGIVHAIPLALASWIGSRIGRQTSLYSNP